MAVRAMASTEVASSRIHLSTSSSTPSSTASLRRHAQPASRRMPAPPRRREFSSPALRVELSSGLGFLGEQLPPAVSRRRASCTSSRPAATAAAAAAKDFRKRAPKDVNVLVVGSTGYIGKYVVKELVKRGYNVIAVAREKAGIGGKMDEEKTREELPGANFVFSDVTDERVLTKAVSSTPIDVVADSWKIDYQATRNAMEAGKAAGAKHFVLLSAICVQKPLLEFQKAKLKFEAELQADEDMTFSIVRPTAFFKSLAGQVESVKSGGPYVMFGDGQLASCKPISEADLASFIADCVQKEDKINQVLPIGGPGEALSALQQGTMLFEIVGKKPKFIKVPIQLMDGIIGFLEFVSRFFPSLEDGVEFGRIGRYYAAESMLLLDPDTGKYDASKTPSYGKDTLEAFFKRAVKDGLAGQELGDQAVWGQK
eukprot:jgi/Chlat1/8032/Chrsp71S07505